MEVDDRLTYGPEEYALPAAEYENISPVNSPGVHDNLDYVTETVNLDVAEAELDRAIRATRDWFNPVDRSTGINFSGFLPTYSSVAARNIHRSIDSMQETIRLAEQHVEELREKDRTEPKSTEDNNIATTTMGGADGARLEVAGGNTVPPLPVEYIVNYRALTATLPEGLPPFKGPISTSGSLPMTAAMFLSVVDDATRSYPDADKILCAVNNCHGPAKGKVTEAGFRKIKSWDEFKDSLQACFPVKEEDLATALRHYHPERQRGEQFNDFVDRLRRELDFFSSTGEMESQKRDVKIKELLIDMLPPIATFCLRATGGLDEAVAQTMHYLEAHAELRLSKRDIDMELGSAARGRPWQQAPYPALGSYGSPFGYSPGLYPTFPPGMAPWLPPSWPSGGGGYGPGVGMAGGDTGGRERKKEPEGSSDATVMCVWCNEYGHRVHECKVRRIELSGDNVNHVNQAAVNKKSPTSEVVCFWCGSGDHRPHECKMVSSLLGNKGDKAQKEGADGVLQRCGRCGRRGHVVGDCFARIVRPRGTNATCFGCGQRGHYVRSCPDLQAGAAVPKRNTPTEVALQRRVAHLEQLLQKAGVPTTAENE